MNFFLMFRSLKHHSTLVTLVLLLTTITCVVLFLFLLVERNDYPLRWLLFFWISLLLIYLTSLANIFLRSKRWPSTIIMSLLAPIVIISVIEICTWSSNVSDHFYNAGANVFVAGSAIFGSENYEETINDFRDKIS